MSQIHQGRSAGPPLVRGRSRLGAASRRAVEYFVDPDQFERNRAVAEPRDQATAEFAPEAVADAMGMVHVAPVVLPLTRSGGYERQPVDARLAELEAELAAARTTAASTGVEGEVQRLGVETAEILRVAHQKAQELVARATAEGDALRTRAHADADAITWAAEQRLRELDGDTDLIWTERTRLTDDTLRLAEALREIAEGAVERFPAAVEEPAPPVAVEAELNERGGAGIAAD